jgi:TDG/mug DNA glycosylase family protein
VDRTTVALYDDRGLEWADTHRTPGSRSLAEAFAGRVGGGALRIDLGCGAGRYTEHLGRPIIGFDASSTMLEACRAASPGGLFVQGDVERLPFARGSLAGAWSWMTHLHVPRARLPLALWDLHRTLAVGAPFELQVQAGDEGLHQADDALPGRFFAEWGTRDLVDAVVGAGFEVDPASVTVDGDELRLRAVRARTLADTVGPGMRLLVCGLNPSLVAADAGVGFAGPTNRFWKAAMAAGVVTRDRDPLDALFTHGMGMTDLVKRATRAADQLGAAEYRAGAERLDRLAAWLQPAALCLVGLAGWRAVAGPRAGPGLQTRRLGGRPVYVMPSTSGLNARCGLDQLVSHLEAALDAAREA